MFCLFTDLIMVNGSPQQFWISDENDGMRWQSEAATALPPVARSQRLIPTPNNSGVALHFAPADQDERFEFATWQACPNAMQA